MGPPPGDEDLEKNVMDARSLSPSHVQAAPYAHKVAIPPRQNLLKEFQATIKETFFADDPLRSFKDQTKSRKFILGIEAIFPILNWGRAYNLKKFRGDVISGLTIASLCIPQVSLLYYYDVNFEILRNRKIIHSLIMVLNLILWLVKQDIGYAKLAHLAPQYGLCKTLESSLQ